MIRPAEIVDNIAPAHIIRVLDTRVWWVTVAIDIVPAAPLWEGYGYTAMPHYTIDALTDAMWQHVTREQIITRINELERIDNAPGLKLTEQQAAELEQLYDLRDDLDDDDDDDDDDDVDQCYDDDERWAGKT